MAKKMTITKKQIVAIVAVVLAALLVAAWAVCALCLGNLNPLKWGQNKPVSDESENPTTQANGMLFLCSSETGNGISLMSAATNDSKAVTVTATIEPDSADYRSVSWTCSDSAIAVTPDTNNPLKATVALVGVLKQTATLTCTVVSATTLTATSTLDYLDFSKVSSTLKHYGLPAGNMQFGECRISGRSDCLNAFDSEASSWTTDCDVFLDNVEIELTEVTRVNISSALHYSGEWYTSFALGRDKWKVSYATLDDDGTDVGYAYYDCTTPATPFEAFVEESVIAGAFTADDFRSAFFKICDGKSDVATFTYKFHYECNGATVANFCFTYNIGFDSSSYMVPVTNVGIDGDGVVIVD